MIDVVLKRAIEEYISNFKVMLSFGALFLFLPLFLMFSQFFLNSGTVYLSLNADLVLGAIGLVLALIFLYIFSFFVSLTVYAVHRDVQTLNLDTYWNTLFKDAALKVFFLYLVCAIVFYLVSALGFMTGLVYLALILNLIIALVVMYAPQSIVLDESTIGEAIGKSVEFWFESPLISIAIFMIASVLLFVILFIELLLDLVGLPGVIVSFFLVLVFLVPFIEQTKSYAYLLKVALLKSNEVTHARAPHIEKPKPLLGTRLRERPKHGSKL
ncbi:MAG: hypothetical protein WC821_02930 [archaeon]|jgi:hypothetical protein